MGKILFVRVPMKYIFFIRTKRKNELNALKREHIMKLQKRKIPILRSRGNILKLKIKKKKNIFKTFQKI